MCRFSIREEWYYIMTANSVVVMMFKRLHSSFQNYEHRMQFENPGTISFKFFGIEAFPRNTREQLIRNESQKPREEGAEIKREHDKSFSWNM